MEEVIGYLIKNVKGSFLTSFLAWIPCEEKEDAYVHKASDLDSIKTQLSESRNAPREESNFWIAPAEIIPARWSKETGVEITGEPTPWTID